MKKAIIFSGIKHSGKTIFALRVSKALEVPFFDLDDLILKRTGYESIRKFYIDKGKEEFQKEELSSYLGLPDSQYVLSLGGGASDNTPLMEEIKRSGNVLIYLRREESLILPVILKDGIPPFLDKNDPVSSFHALYTKRDRIYSSYADKIIDLGEYGDKEEKTHFILNSIKEYL